MKVMKNMVDKADFEAMEKGLPVKKKPELVFETPEFPEIKGLIKGDSIPVEDLVSLTGVRKTVYSEDGVAFMGFNVTVQIKDKKPICGWMDEADVIHFQLLSRKRKDLTVELNYGG